METTEGTGIAATSTEASTSAMERFQRGAQQTGDKASPLLQRYGELLLGQGPTELFQQVEEKTLYKFVADRFGFINERQRTAFTLRISQCAFFSGNGFAGCELVEILLDDRPFLIDSIQAVLNSRNVQVMGVLHPTVSVTRNAKGHLTDVGGFDKKGSLEAHIYFLISPVASGVRQLLIEELRATLRDIIVCVDDFPAILKIVNALKKDATPQTKGQTKGTAVGRLIDWVASDNFIFQGALPCEIESTGACKPRPKEGLGILAEEIDVPPHREALVAQIQRFLGKAASQGGEQPFILMEEAGVLSKVHRRTRFSLLLVAPHGAEPGKEAFVLAGIFTNRSLRMDALEIPVVKEKIKEALAQANTNPGSYNHKELLDYFNGLPRYELFRLTVSTMRHMADFFLSVVDHPRFEISQKAIEETDTFRVMLSVPRREISEARMQALRERVESLFNTTAQSVYQVGGPSVSVVNVVLYPYSAFKATLPDPAVMEQAMLEELRSREDRLVQLWLDNKGGESGSMVRTMVRSLPEAYMVAHDDREILADLEHLERLTRENRPQFGLTPAPKGEGVKMVLYAWEKLSLSRVMPILVNLRVLVVEEETYELAFPEGSAYLHSILLQNGDGELLDPEHHAQRLEALVFNILEGRVENDRLNALLLACDFDWCRINLMRLYRNYLMQVGSVYTLRTIEDTLIRRSRATRALVGYFEARFNPALQGREALKREAEEEVADAEREIDNLTEDRIFKAMLNLIQSTLRTSFFQDLQKGQENPVVAVKLKSALIEGLPAPRPLFEIYVYGPLMEGIHLRGDMIARGGLRYSDRPDDFRTEVLGLMATQMKKNALIVPLGSKGGFVVKSLAPYGGNARKAGDDQYAVYIRALLSITDNLQQGKVLPPPQVVRHDEDDPYLVVAADKGTAHLSDTANAVSMDMGFWMGDAFASGGSNGYDHKVVGITARGAWESVKRHFWEMGINTQTEPISVVGIGDMSGDVFGNGMLLSRTLKVHGAFDHRHVFIDPDPDPEASYKERERLFKLPRTAWTDYNPKLISTDGGVFPRGAKEIPLGPNARAMLGTSEEKLSGEEVIQAMLRMPVDLLWNGGIGTYIKASQETAADVGDPNNDAVRIDAKECRAKVIGEGGNLGLTQAARIEYDLQGGLLNTDAIDNAGGVNMSDYEVNLKILLGALLEQGKLPDMEARNTLLAEMTDTVTDTVLYANFRQVLVLSMDRMRSAENVAPFQQLVELLAAEGGLDRRTEVIPNAQRFQQYQSEEVGVPRPVLSVLLAYTKTLLYRRLVDSPLVERPYLQGLFETYFPKDLGKRFILSQVDHPLKKQIIATVVTNLVMDQAGMTLVPEMAAFTGAEWPDVVQAYLLADEVLQGAAFRSDIYALVDKVPAELQYRLLKGLEALLADMVRWLLLNRKQEARGFDTLESWRGALEDYRKRLPMLIGKEAATALTQMTKDLINAGMGKNSGELAAQAPHLFGFLGVHDLVQRGGIDLEAAYALGRQVDDIFRFSWLEATLTGVHITNPWQKQFMDRLVANLALARQTKLGDIVEIGKKGGEPSAWIESYLKSRDSAFKKYQGTLSRVASQEQKELVALAMVIDLLQAV